MIAGDPSVRQTPLLRRDQRSHRCRLAALPLSSLELSALTSEVPRSGETVKSFSYRLRSSNCSASSSKTAARRFLEKLCRGKCGATTSTVDSHGRCSCRLARSKAGGRPQARPLDRDHARPGVQVCRLSRERVPRRGRNVKSRLTSFYTI